MIKIADTTFRNRLYRSSRMQIFLKIAILKRLANFTESTCVGVSFTKTCRLKACKFIKDSNTGVFLWSLGNFKNNFSYRTPPVTVPAPPVAASVFFLKKYYSAAISQPCYDVLIIFFSRHIDWCVKTRTRLLINFREV